MFRERKFFTTGRNMLYFLKTTVRQHLSEPYGQCNRYESREQRSRTQCYRQCVQNQYNNRYNCVPIFIDYYNHDLDYKYIQNKFCENLFNSTSLPMMQQIRDKCYSLCPNDCYHFEYSSLKKYTERQIENKKWFEHIVVLNTEEPMFRYTEEPVLTFTSYLVYCGGLMGLWFGASAHDIIALILDSNLLKRILNYCKNIIQKIINYIKG